MGMGVSNLAAARHNKKDEFYTRYDTIDKEIIRTGDILRGKTVLCDCDDPFSSEFVRYFINNFHHLGLQGLESTCVDTCNGPLHMSITNVPDGAAPIPEFGDDRRETIIRLSKLQGNSLERMNGDGSFKSEECLRILDRSNVVVTNPPFSLAREFITTIVEHGRGYIILGNMNTINTSAVMPLLLDGRLMLGASIHKGDVAFTVPDDYPAYGGGCGIDDHGRRTIRVTSIRWMTGYSYGIGSYPYEFASTYRGHESMYRRYDNYQAINVKATKLIPIDYKGIMGVPMTFLDRYDPEKFEIIGAATSTASRQGLNRLIPVIGDKPANLAMMDGKRQYAKLFIINRHPAPAI